MFYSQLVLTKRGPLGRVWLAAHWEKKLTKLQVSQTDICESVDAIAKPEVPLALRTSGHLLLGVVRIYERKIKYLLVDCGEALQKIQLAYRPGSEQAKQKEREKPDDMVDTATTETQEAITLEVPSGMENEFDDDFAMGSVPTEENFFEMEAAPIQARKEDITLADTFQKTTTEGGDDEMFAEGRGDLLLSQQSTPMKSPRQPEPEEAFMDSPGRLREAAHDEDGFMEPLQDDHAPYPFDDTGIRSEIEMGEEAMTDMAGPSFTDTPEAERGPRLPGGDGEEELGFGMSPVRSVKRKLRPIMDAVIELPAKVIREQLQDTSDIVCDWVPLETKKARKTKASQATRNLQLGPLQHDMPEALRLLIVQAMVRKDRCEEEVQERPTKKRKSLSPEQDRGGGLDLDGLGMDADMGLGIEPDADMLPDSSVAMAEEDFAMPNADIDTDFGADVGFGEEALDMGVTPGEAPDILPEDTQVEEELRSAEDEMAVDKKTGWSVRTRQTLVQLQKSLSGRDDQIFFSDVVKEKHGVHARKAAAQQFFEMLVLHSRSFVSLHQENPLEELVIRPGANFNSLSA